MRNPGNASHTPVRPIHALHVLEATAGGTMRFMENIADATEGINVVCGFAYGTSRADSRLEPFLKRIRERGWETFPIDMRREINLFKDFASLQQLRRVVRTFSPDIIHCHSSKAGALGRAAAMLQATSPLRIYSPHALAVPLGDKYLAIEKLLSRHTERFIAVSESERKQILDFSLAESPRVDVIYPSIDFEHFKPASREEARQVLGLGSNPTVVSIGRLTAQKDPDSFVAIMKRLHARRPDVRGIWVGSGEDEKRFHEKVAAAGLSEVISTVSWLHDVRTHIAAADVFLSTSRFESFGYVTAEALAMHLPAVASDVTGTRDIMRDELQEWLFKPGDYDRAADLLFRLIDDGELASKVGQLGRQLMMRCFSTERMRDSLIKVYTSVLSTARRKSPFPSLGTVAANAEFARNRRPQDDVAA